MTFFLSRDDNKGLYCLLNKSALNNYQLIRKRCVKINKDKKIRLSLKIIFFILKNFINLNLLKKNKILDLKYRQCEIGRHAIATTYRNPKSFNSKVFEICLLIKNTILCCMYTDHAYRICDKISGAFIDHCGYLNGIYFRVFALKKKFLYSLNHPRGFFSIDFSKKNNFKFSTIESALKLHPNNISDKKKNGLKKFKRYLENPKLIPWMSTTKYKKFDLKDLRNFDYVVYCHSFTDGNLWYGNDGFCNLKDWLEFTLNNLKNLKKKVIIKAHPNFYNNRLGEIAFADKSIFEKIKRKYNSDNFIFIDKPLANIHLLNNLGKRTILISHHGTSILEGSILNFKSITSSSTIYSSLYSISNQWSDKKEYLKLLGKNYSKLKFSKKIDLGYVLNQLVSNDYAWGGKNHWIKIIKKFYNLNDIQFRDEELIKKLINQNTKKSEVLANKISSNIETITF